MITSENCIELFLNKVPEFESSWKAHIDYWDGDSAGLSNDITEFSFFFIEHIDSFKSDKLESIFALVEGCLNYGTEPVKDAISTCFLENLVNFSSEAGLQAHLFEKFLGKKSREYCKAWDEFTGIKTKGINY